LIEQDVSPSIAGLLFPFNKLARLDQVFEGNRASVDLVGKHAQMDEPKRKALGRQEESSLSLATPSH
jgi:hypothetical protein